MSLATDKSQRWMNLRRTDSCHRSSRTRCKLGSASSPPTSRTSIMCLSARLSGAAMLDALEVAVCH
eukprot:10504751-Alexandrium_andersonii.AAC.1